MAAEVTIAELDVKIGKRDAELQALPHPLSIVPKMVEGRAAIGRVIGLELRMVNRATGEQEELFLLPLDIPLPKHDYYGTQGWQINATIHCSGGDLNVGNATLLCPEEQPVEVDHS